MRFGLVALALAATAVPTGAALAIAAVPSASEMAYGAAPLQKLDFYRAEAATPAPLVVFVHGGGWKRGDKSNATGAAKIGYFHDRGYAFATIDYRLVPDATVEQQAADVAAAIGWLVRNAGRLGIDSQRIVLMGHSAGAHLAALVGTDPRYLAQEGLNVARLRGVVLLDGAAYDVPAQLAEGPRIMHKTYAQAFGDDPARQRALSPTLQAAAPNAPAFLILNVDREDGRRQSQALAEVLRTAGTAVEARELPGRGLIGHMRINRGFGEADSPATSIVGDWLDRLLKR